MKKERNPVPVNKPEVLVEKVRPVNPVRTGSLMKSHAKSLNKGRTARDVEVNVPNPKTTVEMFCNGRGMRPNHVAAFKELLKGRGVRFDKNLHPLVDKSILEAVYAAHYTR